MSKANQRCGCGSGKKHRNCCRNKKPRLVEVDLDPSNVHDMIGLAYSDKGELLKITRAGIVPFSGETTFRYAYKRANGKRKILTEGRVTDGTCYINPDHPLMMFDHLFAVDTNTVIIKGEKVSVSAIVYSQRVSATDAEVILSQPRLVAWYEYRNIIGSEERLVWKEMIEAICQTEQYTEGEVGIVVDADLDKHPQYNKSELPIYDEYYLPARITLLYGSADAGMENLANKMIRFCDKKATYLLNALKNGYDAGEDGEVEGKPYSHFRQWFPDYGDGENQLHL